RLRVARAGGAQGGGRQPAFAVGGGRQGVGVSAQSGKRAPQSRRAGVADRRGEGRHGAGERAVVGRPVRIGGGHGAGAWLPVVDGFSHHEGGGGGTPNHLDRRLLAGRADGTEP